MVLQQAARVGWTELWLWKADIKSAYGQLFIAAKQSKQDANLLIACLVNRRHVHDPRISSYGSCLGPDIKSDQDQPDLEIHCDEFQGACSKDILESEKHIACDFTIRLLGPKASEGPEKKNKYESGRQIERISVNQNNKRLKRRAQQLISDSSYILAMCEKYDSKELEISKRDRSRKMYLPE